ncbi:MAG: universal stress protein [Bacteroidota bacterium]
MRKKRFWNVNRILVPTDFSEPASRALASAVALANVYRADVWLLHIPMPYAPEVYGIGGEVMLAADPNGTVMDQIEQKMAEAVEVCVDAEVPVHALQQSGFNVGEIIVAEANRVEADVIVIGTHGRRGLARFMIGSVAEYVARHAPMSVLMVPKNGALRPRRVLVPTDFSEDAKSAVEIGKELADARDAILDVLHVVEPLPLPTVFTLGSRDLYQYLPGLRENILRELHGLVAGAQVITSTHIAEGHAAHTIATFAATHDTGLIVMTPHGASGVARYVLGSTTEKVCRSAPCSVLIARPAAIASPKAV